MMGDNQHIPGGPPKRGPPPPQKKACFKPFTELHIKNNRPFYVVFTERALKIGVPKILSNNEMNKILGQIKNYKKE